MYRELIIKYKVNNDGEMEYIDNTGFIVRCRDCKNCYGVFDGEAICGIEHGMHEPDWFCADGKRRDDEAD